MHIDVCLKSTSFRFNEKPVQNWRFLKTCSKSQFEVKCLEKGKGQAGYMTKAIANIIWSSDVMQIWELICNLNVSIFRVYLE